MHPIILQCGPVTLFSYGLMVALAFLVGTFLAQREGTLQGISSQKMMDFALCLVIFGIVGARFLYVVRNFSFYAADPIEILMIHKGGLSFFGGLILAVLGCGLYLRLNKLPALKFLDVWAPYVALGQAIGRIGCLLNGCCYGSISSSAFAIYFPDDFLPRHPVQIYSSLLLLCLYVVLRVWQIKKRGALKFSGELFFTYLLCYGVIRFSLEYLRGDHVPIVFGLTFFQLISILIILISGSFLWIKKKSFISSR